MTSAGSGARQQQAAAQRRVGKAEQDLAAARAAEHAWSAGALGEEQVADVLDGLAPLGWVVLHDVAWPGRARANLDHVLIGPGGVLVIDTKNWSGTVTVDATGGLRCNGYRKTKEVEAVQAARQSVLAITSTLTPDVVAGLICLAAQEQAAVTVDSGTVVVGRQQLLQYVLDLPPVLSTQTVRQVGMTLTDALRRRPAASSARGSRGSRGSRNTASAVRRRSRKQPDRRGRKTLVKLAVLGLILGGFLLFPDQVMQAYTSLATAVITPLTDQLLQNLNDGPVPPPPTP